MYSFPFFLLGSVTTILLILIFRFFWEGVKNQKELSRLLVKEKEEIEEIVLEGSNLWDTP